MEKFNQIIAFIKELYKKDKIGLHEPVFFGNEKKYLTDCIETTYVSYVGQYVERFENAVSDYIGSSYAIAVVNGTVGLFIALKVCGVNPNDEVITQSLTFVATANAISHCGAYPVFIDVDVESCGMSPDSLKLFFQKYTKVEKGSVVNKYTGRRISAVLPVHVFGHPCRIDEIVSIANEYGVPVVEDTAEALGSFYKDRHCGTFGKVGVISFNGNKIITTGGGGMIITDDKSLAGKIRHLTTTAKVNHPWEYIHDEIGYNYRMPNINAALGVAQMENFDKILEEKKMLARIYCDFFEKIKISFLLEPTNAKSNYWLNAIILKDRKQRDEFLKYSNRNNVQTRPVWRLLYKLPIYKDCYKLDLKNSEWLGERIVNIPSGLYKI